MQYEAIEEVLPRQIDDADFKKLLGEISAHLRQAVNFGTHILKWCGDATSIDSDADLAVIISLRHALELLDATTVLFENCCIDACKVQLRALFEAVLNITYMLQQDTRRRGMAYLVCHVDNRVKLHKKLDSSTPEGKEFAAKLRKDDLLKTVVLGTSKHTAARVQNLERLLARPEYAEAQNELQRLRAQGKRSKWYSFYDGPISLEQLASVVGWSGMYEWVYRQYSGPVHGTDLIAGSLSKGEQPGKVLFYQLRNPRDLQECAAIAVELALSLFRLTIKKYVPERQRELQYWYVAEMRSFNLRITGPPFLTVV